MRVPGKGRVLAVGSVALDTITTPFGSVKDALGGSASYFSAACRFFAPVSVVAAVGEDFPERYRRRLRSLGVDLSSLKTEPGGRTFRWSGRYDFDLNTARTLKTELNVFRSFRPSLTREQRHAGVVFLANIDPDLQASVLRQADRAWLTASDTMNFWIQSKKKSLVSLLKGVRVFLCNESEARQLSGEYNLLAAARWVLARGPKLVVIKKGEHGVLCFAKDFIFLAPAYLLEKVYDPTGAGDSFAGGFIGSLAKARKLNAKSIRRAVVYGSVLASYNVESFSLNRLASITPTQIQQRFIQFGQLTKF